MPEDVAAPYLDSASPIAARVGDLLSRMTLDEKLAQLGGVWPADFTEAARFSDEKAAEALRDGIGHISRIAASGVLAPREVATLANDAQRFLVERTRLGIPAIVHEESCAGFTAKDATCFPQAIGLAATWDPALIERMAAAIRRQMRAVGAHQSLAPVLDITRDPRWGRVEETFGEDPHLASRMGVAYVRGLQGEDLAAGVAATGKHFLGYGASEGGLNWAPAHLGTREILEVYAAPFAAAIREAGLASIMNGYHEIDGVPCGASKWLLTDLLRDDLGFDGVVVADYFTVQTLRTYHRLSSSREEVAARALEVGLDVELPVLSLYRQPLAAAVASGRVDMATVDRAVERVLRLKFALGLFEQPYVDAAAAPAAFDTPDDRALARTIAQRSIVLLKNDGLLPLDRGRLRRIAVIGPSADSGRLLQGDYHYPTHLEGIFGTIDDGTLPREFLRETQPMSALAPTQGDGAPVDLREHFPRMVTLLEGIRAAAPDATVRHARGCHVLGEDTSGFADAVAAAREADVAIVAVGGRSGLVDGCTSGEASDRADLALSGVQQRLVEAVIATGTRVVVVLINGGVLAAPWIAEQAPAVIEAWLPGEEGGNALADVLFGDVNPSGRLPVTIPRAVGQAPLFYNHKPSGGRSNWRTNYSDLPVSPLFPFGHGLSYTTFAYGPLSLSSASVDGDGAIDVSLEITNGGDRFGDEVVQLYVRDLNASVTRPVKQLVGFERVSLAAAGRATVRFTLDMQSVAFYDESMRLVVEEGDVDVMVGASSEDIRGTATFTIRRDHVIDTTLQR